MENILQQPIWVKISKIPILFGVGKECANKWREKGYILCRTQNNSIQVRVADVCKVMEAEAIGIMPRVINRNGITKGE